MATNPLVDIFRIRDLRQRILFTLGMLVVFRLGANLPIPGINVKALNLYFMSQQGGAGVGITEYIDFFAGGAFKNFSIFMLGIMPYISTSIIMQLLVLVFPSLKRISEQEGGRKKIQRYTRYGTVVICLIQSYAVTIYANQIPDAININRTAYTFIAMLTVTTGTIFLMWIGEQISQRGIGNGISLLIFAGIVARMPAAFITLIEKVQIGELNPVFVILVLGMFIAVIGLVIYEQQGQRKIPVQYAKRVVGRRMYGAQNTYIPFKINPSGVIPVIFASSVLTFPLQIAGNLGGQVSWLQSLSYWLRPNGIPYLIMYTLLIIFFAYFYTQVTLNPHEIAKQIRENGGSIPGIRTDKIEEYLNTILSRIILPGALFLAFIAVIPSIVQMLFNFPLEVAMLMGGTSLLIMVGVDLDTMSQIEGHLRMHHHDGLVKKGKIRSRNL
ncbi:preprotein translocase subunit SecY [Marispirochaeta aestuarii]|uniref:Protein translocase subunit SecY n=1 Tax=Marispirochaeta aestuarii TaxID=1963862 RepID=A0A1Y1S3J4_9SPIO|nr:preprotein translocase subunit SecY [Marispirochaeta aestuarii]ORC38226.1 preprotein translocase subunit SecY [Marispirochaeta aestuarii]